jgi:transposase
MSGFIQGEDRHRATLFPESLDEYVAKDSAVRVIDVFVDDLDISGLGFKTEPAETGRPAYHPRTMLKIYISALARVRQAGGWNAASGTSS